MANPYHDADGKFCSRGEMQTAIDNAARAGQLDVYFRLRKDMDEIEKNKVVVDKDRIVNSLISRSSEVKDETDPEILSSLYSQVNAKQQSSVSGNHGWSASYNRDLYLNPHTPEDVKAKIFQEADEALAERLISSQTLTVEEEKKLLERFGGLNDYIVTATKLSDEEKVDYALKNENFGLMADILEEAENPAELYNRPGAMTAVEASILSANSINNNNKNNYVLRTFLETVPEEETRAKIYKTLLASDPDRGGDALSAYMANPSASFKERRKVLASTLSQNNQNIVIPETPPSEIKGASTLFQVRFNDLSNKISIHWGDARELRKSADNYEQLFGKGDIKQYKSAAEEARKTFNLANKQLQKSNDSESHIWIKKRQVALDKFLRNQVLTYSSVEGLEKLDRDLRSLNSTRRKIAKKALPLVKDQLIGARVLNELRRVD